MIHRAKLPSQPVLLAALSVLALALGCSGSDGPRNGAPSRPDASNAGTRAGAAAGVASIRALLGDTFGAKEDADFEIGADSPTARTEVGDPSRSRGPKASLIFGSKALGLKGGQFLNFENNVRPQVDVWPTVAQALLRNDDPLGVLHTSEQFNRTGAGPIEGLWAKPA